MNVNVERLRGWKPYYQFKLRELNINRNTGMHIELTRNINLSDNLDNKHDLKDIRMTGATYSLLCLN